MWDVWLHVVCTSVRACVCVCPHTLSVLLCVSVFRGLSRFSGSLLVSSFTFPLFWSLMHRCLSPGLLVCPIFSVSLYVPMPLALPNPSASSHVLLCVSLLLSCTPHYSITLCLSRSAVSLLSHEAPHPSASLWTPPGPLPPHTAHVNLGKGGATEMMPQWHHWAQLDISQRRDLDAHPRPEFIPGPAMVTGARVMGYSLPTEAWALEGHY